MCVGDTYILFIVTFINYEFIIRGKVYYIYIYEFVVRYYIHFL